MKHERMDANAHSEEVEMFYAKPVESVKIVADYLVDPQYRKFSDDTVNAVNEFLNQNK